MFYACSLCFLYRKISALSLHFTPRQERVSSESRLGPEPATRVRREIDLRKFLIDQGEHIRCRTLSTRTSAGDHTQILFVVITVQGRRYTVRSTDCDMISPPVISN